MRFDRSSEVVEQGPAVAVALTPCSEPLSELEVVARRNGEKFVRWFDSAEPAQVQALMRGLTELVRRAMKGKPGREELQESFGRALDMGRNVTREEIAAWHGLSVRQVNRWIRAGKLARLPEYGRKAMFDARVACRLRPRKEG